MVTKLAVLASTRLSCPNYKFLNLNILPWLCFHFYFLDPVDCQYVESESSDAALLTVAYIMAAVCVLCLLPISVLLIQASLKRRNTTTTNNNNNDLHNASSETKLTDSSQPEKYSGTSRTER